MALAGSHHALRRSRGIQVRDVEGVRWGQVPSPRRVGGSVMLDLSLPTCQMGRGASMALLS